MNFQSFSALIFFVDFYDIFELFVIVFQAGGTRDPIEEVKAAEASGRSRYVTPTIGDGTDSKPQGEEKEKPAVPKPVASAAALE